MTSSDDAQLFSKVLSTVRASTALAAQDVDFCRSMSKDLGDSIDATSSKFVDLINGLLLAVDRNTDPIGFGRDRLDDSWKDFSNLMDNLFEQSDRSIDSIMRSPFVKNNTQMQHLDDLVRMNHVPSTKIVKPQLSFESPVDNTESHPFVPRLKDKPFALQPFTGPKLIPADDTMPEHYEHPYQYEIERQEYDSLVLLKSKPIPSQPWDTTEAIWVDNIESLAAMLSDLQGTTEIAVDLEHHDLRSYYGIVCLMQISTRTTDYLIDTLSLRDELQVLNEVFANPKILKVFHGAFMDIIWLQRDLGLYVVSLFDTYHASRAIGLPRHSLAYLLERYANFKTSKKYQLADWRLRPLSKPMNAYARADTHFLLNIYDQLRNTLIEQSKLAGVLSESRNVAKRRFEYSKFRPSVPSTSVYCPVEKADPSRILMDQYNIPPEKEDIMEKLYNWRDMIARRDDESPRYVMPNQLLVSLAVYCPTTPVDVVSVSNIVSDHVRSNSLVLANLIKNSLESVKSSKSRSTSQPERNHKLDTDSVMTVSQIKRAMATFENVSHVVLDSEFPRQADGRSAKLIHILTSGNNAVDYSDEDPHPIGNEQFALRSRGALQAMEEFDNTVAYSMPIPESEPVAQDLTNESHVTSQGTSEQIAEDDEDKDEIITLKKVVKHVHPPKVDIKRPSAQAVDYSKGKKILGADLTSSKKRESRKRNFDPYSASNDTGSAPRGLKKRRSTNKGRNVSFKR